MVTMQRNASKNAVSTEKKLNSGMDQRGKQLREEFSRQFLHGMSDRIQSDFGPKQLERFLNNKFEFFSWKRWENRDCFVWKEEKGPVTRIIRQDTTLLPSFRL